MGGVCIAGAGIMGAGCWYAGVVGGTIAMARWYCCGMVGGMVTGGVGIGGGMLYAGVGIGGVALLYAAVGCILLYGFVGGGGRICCCMGYVGARLYGVLERPPPGGTGVRPTVLGMIVLWRPLMLPPMVLSRVA